MSASAQYTTDKLGTAAFLADRPGYIDYVILDADVEALLAADKNYQLQYVGPNDDTRNLYIWSSGETFVAGETKMPGVDDGFGYFSMNQAGGDIKWCGAGYNIAAAAPVDFSHFTDETELHVAYACQNGNITSMYLTVLDESAIESPGAQVSLGAAYEGNPVVAPAPKDEWQGFVITLGDLKKESNKFKPNSLDKWYGNVFAFGGTTESGFGSGANLSFDAVYFFTPGEPGAIESIENNASQIVVSNRTISCAGAESIALYNLNGQLVKSAATSVLGLDNLATGVYVAKAGNSVAKVAVK